MGDAHPKAWSQSKTHWMPEYRAEPGARRKDKLIQLDGRSGGCFDRGKPAPATPVADSVPADSAG
jgi:hypothetical protein